MRKLRFRTIKWLVQGPIEQRSPTFLAPETRFVEDNFSTDWGRGMVWGWFKDIAFLYFCYSISSTSDHQALDPGGWEPGHRLRGVTQDFLFFRLRCLSRREDLGICREGSLCRCSAEDPFTSRCLVFLTSSVARLLLRSLCEVTLGPCFSPTLRLPILPLGLYW